MKLKTLKPRIQTVGNRLPTMQPGSWRTDKQTSAQRGYGYKWQQAREGWLREHPFCVRCLKEAGIAATETKEIIVECVQNRVPLPHANVVDHRIPHRGDMVLFWDKTNWQSLCTPHHSSDKQREEQRL